MRWSWNQYHEIPDSYRQVLYDLLEEEQNKLENDS